MTRERLDEYLASLALRHTPSLGPKTWKGLLAHFGSARAAVDQASRWQSLGLARERQSLSFRSRKWSGKAKAEREAAVAGRHRVVLWTDPGYPPLLREISDPPLFLYYTGRLELAKGPCLAVVGSRTCSAAGLGYARKIGRELSEAGLTVVSGMAWGIDRQAHQAALEGPGSSIGVLGAGLDRIYPRDNKDIYRRLASRGLLMTEFAPGTEPLGANFPRRNRIISGMSLGVLLVEAPLRSGGRITTSLALEQGREVYVVAGPGGGATFAGCRELMDQGARAVTSAGEIILDLAPLLREEIKARDSAARAAPRAADNGPPVDLSAEAGGQDAQAEPVSGSEERPRQPELSKEEKAVIDALAGDADRKALHIDAVGRVLGWPPGKVSEVLLGLEVQGLVTRLPGMYYSASNHESINGIA